MSDQLMSGQYMTRAEFERFKEELKQELKQEIAQEIHGSIQASFGNLAAQILSCLQTQSPAVSSNNESDFTEANAEAENCNTSDDSSESLHVSLASEDSSTPQSNYTSSENRETLQDDKPNLDDSGTIQSEDSILTQERSEWAENNLQNLFAKSSDAFPFLDRDMMVNTSLVFEDKPERKSHHSVFPVNWNRTVPPLPSTKNTLDFYIEDFEYLVKSDHIELSRSKDIQKLNSSVRGQVLFLRNGKLSVWMCGRNPGQCTLKVKANVADPRGRLPDLMVGEATWSFYETNSKGKWQQHIGAIDCELIKTRGYYYDKNVLVRYLVEVLQAAAS